MDRNNTFIYLIFAILVLAAVAVAVLAVRDNQGVEDVDNTNTTIIEEASPSPDPTVNDELLLPGTSPAALPTISPTAQAN